MREVLRVSSTIHIRGIDPLLFGDGRPFHNEDGALSARTLSLPLPGTRAGMLRTHSISSEIGKDKNFQLNPDGTWPPNAVQAARAIGVSGPILKRNSTVLFPAPVDCVVYKPSNRKNKKTVQAMQLKPMKLQHGNGCNLPNGMLPLGITKDDKPEPGYNYWPFDNYVKWLENYKGSPELDSNEWKIHGLDTEQRVHAAIDESTGSSMEGMLYTTTNVCFDEMTPTRNTFWSLLSKVDCNIETGAASFGGERRLAAIEQASESDWPSCPDALKNLLQSTMKIGGLIRMVLVTPALFSAGWRPGWLDSETMTGTPPGLDNIQLRLISAAVPRFKPVSGWDYAKRVPKPVRWMAPAGSVYFFEVVDGNVSDFAENAWLQSMSDDIQDRRDSYGLAAWGVWEYHTEDTVE